MAISNKIQSIEEHLTADWKSIENLGLDVSVDNNIENIANVLDDMYDYLPKVTGSGTDLTLNDTNKGKLVLTPKASDMVQFTTTGKNLINIDLGLNSVLTKSGDTYTITKNGNSRSSALVDIAIEANTQITVQYNLISTNLDTYGSGTTTLTFAITYDDNTIGYIALYGLSTGFHSAEYTLNKKVIKMQMFMQYDFQDGAYVTFNNMMISTTGGNYEPYTGGIASPNPSYPQTIHTISGDNTIKVENKNKWKSDLPVLLAAEDGTFQANNNGGIDMTLGRNSVLCYIIYDLGLISDYAGKTLTYSISNSPSAMTKWCSFINLSETGANRTELANFGSSNNAITYTVGDSYSQTHLGVRLYIFDGTPGQTYSINQVMVEESSEKTSFVEHEEQVATLTLGYDLPAEYTQVDYIESSGTQYINTNVNLSSKKIGVVLDFQLTSGVSTNVIIGATEADNTSNYRFALWNYNGQTEWRTKINDVGYYSGLFDTNRHLLEFNTNNGTKLDNNIIDNTQYTLQSSENLLLLSEALSGGYTKANAKIYYCKIYEDSTLLRDLVPCYRNSDNEIGMYDVVNNVFYTNQGTGTFSKGNDAPNGYEVCKMPDMDYEDEFYLATASDTGLTAGKWYLKKNIGKYVFTGNETLHVYQNSTIYTDFVLSNEQQGLQQTTIAGLCNYADISVNTYIMFTSNASRGFEFKHLTDYWGLTEVTENAMATFLQNKYNNNNPVTIRYPLRNPTYTLLNNTLQNELNTLKDKLLAYKGQTNISQVNDDLPFTINASALMDLTSLTLEGGE